MGGAATAYNVDVSQSSVSGLSSGAFMAVQLPRRVLVDHEGAQQCSRAVRSRARRAPSLLQRRNACMRSHAPSAAPFVSLTNQYFAAGSIDDPKNLSSQKVFLFGGASDYTVNPVVMDSLQSYYASFISQSNIKYESRHANTGHTMPTVSYGGTCGTTADPWIGNCGYDGAGIALQQIYGTLNSAATSLSGEYVTLDQSQFLSNPQSHSVAATGYAYVPAACKSGDQCKVHVAFHGCEQEATRRRRGQILQERGLQPVGGHESHHRPLPADDDGRLVLEPERLLGLVGIRQRRLFETDGPADGDGPQDDRLFGRKIGANRERAKKLGTQK